MIEKRLKTFILQIPRVYVKFNNNQCLKSIFIPSEIIWNKIPSKIFYLVLILFYEIKLTYSNVVMHSIPTYRRGTPTQNGTSIIYKDPLQLLKRKQTMVSDLMKMYGVCPSRQKSFIFHYIQADRNNGLRRGLMGSFIVFYWIICNFMVYWVRNCGVKSSQCVAGLFFSWVFAGK